MKDFVIKQSHGGDDLGESTRRFVTFGDKQSVRHTPAPWVAVARRVESVDDLADIATACAGAMGQGKVGRTYEEECANAEFIARACNHHEELFSCLEILQNRARCRKLTGENKLLFNRIEAVLSSAREEV